MRESTTIRRCISIMLTMYLRSRSPSSALTSSWIASSSRPSWSSCSGVRRVRGLSIRLGIAFLFSVSQQDVDRALGRVDAGADHLAALPVDLTRAQVTDAAVAQPSDAGVADPHAAAVRQCRAGVLAGHEDRLRAVGGRRDSACAEVDRAAVALLALLAAEVGLEVLDVQLVAVAQLLLPVRRERAQHFGRAGEERLALAPVGAQPIEVGWRDAPVRGGVLLVQAEAAVAPVDRAQLLAEDHVAGGARRVQMHDVGEAALVIEAAQHG